MSEIKVGMLKLPITEDSQIPLEKRKARSEKNALYIPAERLEGFDFHPSTISPDILITRDIMPVIATVARWGEVGPRYSRDGILGLEEDQSKKQIILYSAVIANGQLLWYQRAGEQIGDERLIGKYSIGFGGHKTREDIHLTHAEQLMLGCMMPGFLDYLEVSLGTARGLFAEIEEELKVKQHDIKSVRMLGAFLDNRVTDPTVSVQVGWVHLCLPVVIELDPNSIKKIHYLKDEIKRAWWEPLITVSDLLNQYQQKLGVSVESWTEVMIREFLPT